MSNRDSRDYLPDVQDGLTHHERVVLWCLKELPHSTGFRGTVPSPPRTS
jgi:hypothetical protein